MLAALPLLLLLTPPKHFDVTAEYQPGPKKQGAVAVTFKANDPDVVVNETPGPRLALDAAQTVLVDKQPPAPKVHAPEPGDGKYLDLGLPVVFPVALAPSAATGLQDVKAKVTYFYCSKREGWCRKGTADVDIPVKVP